MDKRDELMKIFSRDIREILKQTPAEFDQVQEIRLRIHAPLLMVYYTREYYLTPEGKLSKQAKEAYVVSRSGLKETLEYISSYSLYAFEEELKQGFITVQGGHRIGVAGKAILDASGIRGMKFISFINVRLSHQVRGCADRVMPYLYKEGRVLHTLIISSPGCGKTTLLRDVIRQISDGCGSEPGINVGVVDERSEIGACYQGMPQNELGIRTDILDCCPKAQGMMMMIRTMSPQVIAVDEIGGRKDMEAIAYVMNCGCKLIATVHGNSLEDIRQKPVLGKLMEERWFERYIVLDNERKMGKIKGIYDSRGQALYPAKGEAYDGRHLF